MASSMSLPNPDIYLNHLPPQEANQFEVSRNFYLAILGAYIWDVLVYVPEDIKIVYNNFGIITICFIAARMLSVTHALLWVILSTRSIALCNGIIIAMGIVCQLAMSCTSFFFLRKVQAVYSRKRIVRWFFAFLWFAVSMLATTVPVGVKAQYIEGTRYCMIYEFASYTAIGEFLPAVFDTLVFFAISYKLISDHTTTENNKWKSFFTGKSLPIISHAILRGGQQYYLIVFVMTIVTGFVLYSPYVPVTYRPVFAVAQTTLATSMACRVFRNMKSLSLSTQSSRLPRPISSVGFSKVPPNRPTPFSTEESFNITEVSQQTTSTLA